MILDLLIASRVFEISSGADLDDTAKIITANVDAKMGSCRKTWTALNADASQMAVKILNTSQSCKEFQAAIDADKSHLQVTALSTARSPVKIRQQFRNCLIDGIAMFCITSTQVKMQLTLRPAIPHNQVPKIHL